MKLGHLVFNKYQKCEKSTVIKKAVCFYRQEAAILVLLAHCCTTCSAAFYCTSKYSEIRSRREKIPTMRKIIKKTENTFCYVSYAVACAYAVT